MAIIEFGTDDLEVILEADAGDEVADLVVDPPLTQPQAAPAKRTAATDGRGVVAGLGECLSGWWAAGLVVAWIGIFTTGVMLEPAPSDPNAASPLAETMLGLALMIAWVVMAAGCAKRRRYGAAGSLVGAVILVGMTIACPVSGHHSAIGAWWWFELAGSTTLVGFSGGALRSV